MLPGEPESTVAVLVKHSTCQSTGHKGECISKDGAVCSLSSCPPDLDSLKQYSDVVLGLLLGVFLQGYV